MADLFCCYIIITYINLIIRGCLNLLYCMKRLSFFKLGAILLVTVLSGLLLAYLFLDHQQEPYLMDADARAQAPGRFINLSMGPTHYQLLGPESGELVVLIHGGMVSGMYAWKYNAEKLAQEGYRVLLYDLYGRGYSERVQADYTPQLFFGQFRELLDSLQIHEPFNLAGLSLGSMVAIDFSQTHPQQVKNLVLISPAARGKFKLRPVLRFPLVSDLLMTAWWRPRAINNQMEEFYRPADFPGYRAELEKMAAYKGYKESNRSTWLHTLTYNMEAEIASIGQQGTPVCLILGKHDPYVAPDEAEVYQSYLPQLEIYQIGEAGHIVNFEKADTVNSIMDHFFSKTSYEQQPLLSSGL